MLIACFKEYNENIAIPLCTILYNIANVGNYGKIRTVISRHHMVVLRKKLNAGFPSMPAIERLTGVAPGDKFRRRYINYKCHRLVRFDFFLNYTDLTGVYTKPPLTAAGPVRSVQFRMYIPF